MIKADTALENAALAARTKAIEKRHVTALAFLFGLFASAVVVTNAVSGNVINVGPFTFVAGTLLYPVTFLLTDVLSEVFGKRAAQRAVWCGFVAQLLAVAFIQALRWFPSIDPEMAAAFEKLFAPVPRIVLGSMTAYLIAQSIDVRLFHAIRDRTHGEHLWLRNNGSTLVSQAVDTAVFVVVAFAGVLDTGTLVAMALGQYTAKAIMAAADTPLCYAAVELTRKYIRGGRP